MKVILFAYEFPPIQSAQSLRWFYLCNELAKLGFELDVIVPSLPDIWGFSPSYEQGINVVRTFPGFFVGFSGWIAASKYFRSKHPPKATSSKPNIVDNDHFIEIIYRLCRHILDTILYPDSRTEWFPFAWHKAKILHSQNKYDYIFSSHEPGVDLLLGLRAHRAWKIPWIVDLADPLVAPYTPRWRNRFDSYVERQICTTARSVIVTNTQFGEKLVREQGLNRNKILVINQGFDQSNKLSTEIDTSEFLPQDSLNIVYTGTLYSSFRNADNILTALEGLSDILIVFIGDCKISSERISRVGHSKIKIVGKLPHGDCLALQRKADLLLSIGNAHEDQIPGKLFEYFGSARPILHIATNPSDSIPSLLLKLGRGVGVMNDPMIIKEALKKFVSLWQKRILNDNFNLHMETVTDYSWATGAKKIQEKMQEGIVSSSALR
jgi:glycosyltransferase involved in cell wall biosynthesis